MTGQSRYAAFSPHIWPFFDPICGYPYMGSQGSLGGIHGSLGGIHGSLGGTDGTLGPKGPGPQGPPILPPCRLDLRRLAAAFWLHANAKLALRWAFWLKSWFWVVAGGTRSANIFRMFQIVCWDSRMFRIFRMFLRCFAKGSPVHSFVRGSQKAVKLRRTFLQASEVFKTFLNSNSDLEHIKNPKNGGFKNIGFVPF